MIVVSHLIEGKYADTFRLVPLSDVHFGSMNFDEDKFLGMVDYIKNKDGCYWIGVGDYLEAILPGDKRFDWNNLSKYSKDNLGDLAMKQLAWIEDKFNKIKHKCLGLIAGNHDETMRLKHNMDVMGCLCTHLRIPNLGTEAFVRLAFKRSNTSSQRMIKIFAAHGYGGGTRSGGAPINKLEKLTKDFEADIYLLGHDHRKICSTMEYVTCATGSNNIITKKKLLCMCGSFYKTYKDGVSGYASRNLYPPSATGSVKIIIKPFVHKRINGKIVELQPDFHVSE